MLALPFPKLSHGSSTSQWPGQWLSWTSPRAHCAHPFSSAEVRSTCAWIHSCCRCSSAGARCFSVLPLAVVCRPALRMQPGARLWVFIVWHPPHPAVCRPLSDVTTWHDNGRSSFYRLCCMYVGVGDGTGQEIIFFITFGRTCFGFKFFITCLWSFLHQLPNTITRFVPYLCHLRDPCTWMRLSHMWCKIEFDRR